MFDPLSDKAFDPSSEQTMRTAERLDLYSFMDEKKNKKNEEARKKYKRSIGRVFIAKYIESNYGIPFIEVCEGLESKNSQMIKLVKKAKEEFVDKRFG